MYGRRLVVEWASGETSLEEMRDKTRQQWGRQERGSAGAKRLRMEEMEGQQAQENE